MSGKVTIIGSAGRVGSNTAYALQLGACCSEIALLDVAADAARGEALDLTHGRAAIMAGPSIEAGGYDAIAGSDIVIITAGLRRRPEESRLQLVERNTALFRQILSDVREASLPSDAILLVVTNPVDVLTYVAATELGWESHRVIGLGTVLDTLRVRSVLGRRLGIDPAKVEAQILGEHGDSMVAAFSLLAYEGVPLSSLAEYSQEAADEAFGATRSAGAECLRLKGGAGYAVGLAVRQVVMAILGDAGEVLPVSTLHRSGEFAGVALSLPTRVGRRGVLEVLTPKLSEDERKGLLHSAEVLRQTLGILAGGSSA
jgi:L-lactate dehydrogenase